MEAPMDMPADYSPSYIESHDPGTSPLFGSPQTLIGPADRGSMPDDHVPVQVTKPRVTPYETIPDASTRAAARQRQNIAVKEDAYRMKGLAAATVAQDPYADLHGVPYSTQVAAKSFLANDAMMQDPAAAATRRDSILADQFNVAHYGQDAVDRAQADSARIANNIETLNDAPLVTGAGSLKMKSKR